MSNIHTARHDHTNNHNKLTTILPLHPQPRNNTTDTLRPKTQPPHQHHSQTIIKTNANPAEKPPVKQNTPMYRLQCTLQNQQNNHPK
ncbi:hypothetical protein HYC85_009333 [Camellia sinensis]|uniref:Uncharacterized protein n=1 Tax=Camellia sinensis TaxID=4442 RepID=A0A7J7HFB6_CAMSI|nr:hypothetical protein HYC85_009333 [Camellia sinensis]